ncbi:MAG TPA: sigma-54 dependent transcriptional regulator [Vicinamibacterales bacterium]|nr:sigma-54 dependent transcriptional regulator [Vicinamibacterales bacterium]
MSAQRPHLLVVDDDRAILTLVGTIAQTEGFEVSTTLDGVEALQLLRRRPADLVLLDLRMPGVTGLEILRSIRDITPRTRVALMSGYATIDNAVEAVKLGAIDFLTKPFDLQRMRQMLSAVRDEAAERRAVLALEGELAQRLEFCGMIGRGPAMQEVFGLIRRLAPHARTALITGETGTGKELVARALHKLGPRGAKRFVTVNCSAVVETLFESELFGHVRGAFTGATDHKAGLFETADGGTVFLDEIGELPPSVQAKLLRVLENGELQRVGSLEPRKVDVRLIAATNRDLPGDVAAGRFRSDLYYRLNVAEITLPPLRERREDIPYLTASFVRGFAQRFAKPLVGLTSAAERRLADAPWEGNIRQLRNVLERACILAEGEFVDETELSDIMLQHSLPVTRSAAAQGAAAVAPAARTAPLVEIEREHIVRTLEQVRGNKAVAARLLGISRRAFYRQLERHGLHTSVPAVKPASAAPIVPLGRVS